MGGGKVVWAREEGSVCSVSSTRACECEIAPCIGSLSTQRLSNLSKLENHLQGL